MKIDIVAKKSFNDFGIMMMLANVGLNDEPIEKTAIACKARSLQKNGFCCKRQVAVSMKFIPKRGCYVFVKDLAKNRNFLKL